MRASKTKTEIRQDQIATAALELMARHGPKSLNLARLARKSRWPASLWGLG